MILSKSVRERIGYWVQQESFKEERVQLEVDVADFAKRYRVSWNGGPKACAVIDKLPDGVVNTFFGGNWERSHGLIVSPGRVAYAAQIGHNEAAFAAEATVLKERGSDIEKRAKQLRHDTERALLQCRTTKRAREAFPEFAAMLPDEGATGSEVLVLTDKIRESLCTAGVIKCDEE